LTPRLKPVAVAELVRRGVAERRTKTLYINDYAALRDLVSRPERAPA